MNWKRERWVKLYIREEGTFALLPFMTRAFAGALLKIVDDEGCVCMRPGDELHQAIGMRVGASPGERRQIRRMLDELIADGFLEAVKNGVRIRNWNDAQCNPNAKRDVSESEVNTRRTVRESVVSDERTSGEPPATVVRVASEIEAKCANQAENPCSVEKRREKKRREYTEAFSAAWKAYPRKEGKETAFDAWVDRAILAGGEAELLRVVSAALVWQVQTAKWREKSGEFVPHFTTYLNQGRFQDEPPAARQVSLYPDLGGRS